MHERLLSSRYAPGSLPLPLLGRPGPLLAALLRLHVLADHIAAEDGPIQGSGGAARPLQRIENDCMTSHSLSTGGTALMFHVCALTMYMPQQPRGRCRPRRTENSQLFERNLAEDTTE